MFIEELKDKADKSGRLSDDELNTIISNLQSDNPKIGMLALYGLVNEKSTTLSNDLYEKWIYELRILLSLNPDSIYSNLSIIDDVLQYLVEEVTTLKEKVATETSLSELRSAIGIDTPEDESSIYGRLTKIETALSQITADVFNIDKTIGAEQDSTQYNPVSGRQSLDLSIYDILQRIISAHGGVNISHNGINEDVIWTFNRESITFPSLQNWYIFPSYEGKAVSHSSRSSIWMSKSPATITGLVYNVSANSLNGRADIRVVINGIETGKKISILPNALGLIDVAELGISVKFGDRICIKISTESASDGYIDIDSVAMAFLKGPITE